MFNALHRFTNIRMKITLLLAVGLTLLAGSRSWAQTDQDAADAKPSADNLAGQPYPKVDPLRRATFRLKAPDAKKVQVSVGATYDMIKGADGVWSVTTKPLDAGFHYYWIIVDGVTADDPASETFFGVGRMSSGIEVPSPGEDFYDLKNVPHGEVRERVYFSKTASATRHCFVYTPPGYDQKTRTRYPVLYLQHGMGEDVRGWSMQGRANLILDNLIAAGKAKPMIVVMEDGGIAAGAGGGRGGRGGRGGGSPPTAAPTPTAGFPQILIADTIPMIDATYRTIPDRDHRAMAGLSLGGTQTYQITQANLDKFAWIGAFSAPFGFPDIKTGFDGLLADPKAFAKQVKLLFVSMGSEEENSFGRGNRTFHEALEKAGVKHVYYESPGTAHEWLTWRRSLYNFAPLLFQN
jgi:enterochelin esterase family protein